MSDLFDELGKRDQQYKSKKSGGRQTKAAQLAGVNPLARQQVSQKEATEATMKLTGQYWARTVKIPPEWRELLRDVTRLGGFRSLADAERWIISEGLRAFFERGVRPQFEETIEREAILYGSNNRNNIF